MATNRDAKPPRGMLSFITRESLHISVYDEGTNARLISETRGISKRARRRHRREASRAVEKSLAAPQGPASSSLHSDDNLLTLTRNFNLSSSVHYGHNESEFTLLFFCAPYCHHSFRFAPKLAHFVHSQNERYSGSRVGNNQSLGKLVMQCICIPDCVKVEEVKHMLHGTGFYYFPKCNLDPSYTSIRALIQIQWIPVVLVFSNVTGKIITDWGRTAIEFNEDGCVQAWRDGQSGASYFWRLLTAM